jgi:(1->4)-alpha-D-glucan 1-alpha-D-glucosylmutase
MVRLWSRLNARKRSKLEGLVMPSRNDEYLLYQTLVGAWPGAAANLDAFCERIVHYMEKATREAKVATSWINPNQAYDHAMRSFVEGILDRRRSSRFLDSLASFAERIAYFGRFNSLAQTLIKLTAPGIPDIYQGCELWDLSLVDPDNRRPVDFAHRAQLLAELARFTHDRTTLARELLNQAEDGRIKLYLTQRTLTLRREQPTLFAGADYLPLSGQGEQSAHVVAFARHGGGLEALIVVPRLCVSLARGEQHPPLGALWGETWLPLPHVSADSRYTNWLTGTNLSVSVIQGTPGIYLRDLLADFPVALLVA